MEKYGAGSIVVSDYDPDWPIRFEQESERIRQALGPFALAIEHAGSTSVPGLPSKPIIDILVGVPSLEEAKQRSIEPIKALGYVYMPEYVSWLPGELFFRKGPPGPWTHHLHMMEPSNFRWETLWCFAIICARIRKPRRLTPKSSGGSRPRRWTTSRPIETARRSLSTRPPRKREPGGPNVGWVSSRRRSKSEGASVTHHLFAQCGGLRCANPPYEFSSPT